MISRVAVPREVELRRGARGGKCAPRAVVCAAAHAHVTAQELIDIMIRLDVRSDEAWGLVESVPPQGNDHHSGLPGCWQAAHGSGQLAELFTLIRTRQVSGAAEKLPYQPSLLWLI